MVTAQYVENELPKYGAGVRCGMDTLDSRNLLYLLLWRHPPITTLRSPPPLPVPLRFTMCGTAGTELQRRFFLDHQPGKLGEVPAAPLP